MRTHGVGVTRTATVARARAETTSGVCVGAGRIRGERSSRLDLMLHLAQANKLLVLATGFKTFHPFDIARDYGKVISNGSKVTGGALPIPT